MILKMENIFHSLQEAIITIDIRGVNFSNVHGRKILMDIKNFKYGVQNKPAKTLILEESSSKAEFENKISRAQVFKLYKDNLNGQNAATGAQGSKSDLIA